MTTGPASWRNVLGTALIAVPLLSLAAQAIMCATDGLFMAHVFGLYSLDTGELAAVRGALERLLEPVA